MPRRTAWLALLLAVSAGLSRAGNAPILPERAVPPDGLTACGGIYGAAGHWTDPYLWTYRTIGPGALARIGGGGNRVWWHAQAWGGQARVLARPARQVYPWGGEVGAKVRLNDDSSLRLTFGWPLLADLFWLWDVERMTTAAFGVGDRGLSVAGVRHFRLSRRLAGRLALTVTTSAPVNADLPGVGLPLALSLGFFVEGLGPGFPGGPEPPDR
ncbi:MAG: hypothetical protein R6X12_01395 [bacterium]